MHHRNTEIVIFGGGLSGLSAGYILSRSGREVILIERDPSVGGLAKTLNHNGFRFDLGGHRFLTKNREIEQLVRDVLRNDFLTVQRKSKIYMSGKYFDYPLKPMNAIFGLGAFTTLKIIYDYLGERVRNRVKPHEIVSLEDWVINQFGRRMFDIYFKQYSEKVWGVDCSCISRQWVAQRIKGLSLWEAIKNAFFRVSGRGIPTLADSFIYPRMGIGQIAEGLKKQIEMGNRLLTNVSVIHVYHKDSSIKGVAVRDGKSVYSIEGDEFVSSIPLTNLIEMLHPAAPEDVMEAAARLNYRDLIIVAIMLNRDRVTDLTWMYLPERGIPFGRIHEPKNWSPFMAPEGKTHLVAEYFCFRGDKIWGCDDEKLISTTVDYLEKSGFIIRHDVIGGCVVRVPKAYPLLDLEYEKHRLRVLHYLSRFKNLHIAGRGGMFRYLNMDHAIESGIEAANDILKLGQQRESLPSVV